MVLPFLSPPNSKARKSQMQDRFLGLWQRENADPGQFVMEYNMASDEYPYMAPRKLCHMARDFTNCTALLGGEALSWVDNNKLYYDGNEICTVTSDDPQLVRMGAYLIVWPDKIVYNTHTGELTSMDHTYKNVVSGTVQTVNVRPCTISGVEYSYTTSDTPPSNPSAQSYWYNTQDGALYQYLNGEWQGIDTVYSRIAGPDLGAGFGDYDVVSLSGFGYPEFNLDAATVYAHGEDYIVIATGSVRNFDQDGRITIKRSSPEMDWICENGNRLWGCSSKSHEIYGSKLGDPTNWNCYLGISTDSYAATVGSEGAFTGCIAYMGYVHFFKEDRCHRLYGTRPENFNLVELPIRGVKAGCHKSLCVVNGILYYVNRNGVMAFDGSSPVSVGDALGDVMIENAVCGAHGNVMYMHATISGDRHYDNGGAVNRICTMDTARGLWHGHENGIIRGFASTPEGDFAATQIGLVMLDGEGKTSKYDVPGEAHDEDEIEWMCETGDNGEDSPNQKFIKRITYRVKAEHGSRFMVDIMYDSDGNWQRALTYTARGKTSTTLMLRAKRCDHFKLRYYGSGKVMVLSMCKTYDEGSEKVGKP